MDVDFAVDLSDLVAFVAEVRRAGVQVGIGQDLSFARAVAVLDPLDIDDLFWAGVCCLVRRHEDLAAFRRVFDAYFRGVEPTRIIVRGTAARRGELADELMGMRPVAMPTDRARPHDGTTGASASDLEALRRKDFSACTPSELAEIARLVSRLTLPAPRRASRRTRRAAKGHRPDLRRLLRDAPSAELRPGRIAWRQRRTRVRPVVLLLDVSGSMARYSRLLLQFGYSARRGPGRVEVFCFGTRLTRVTPTLAARDPDAALAEAAHAVFDWDGGTRIGESLRTYLREYGQRAGYRGAVVVLCSDGLERGDPDVLGAQMARLSRLSHFVIWVNPLAGGQDFAPITRGMTAALPHVDELIAGHSLASLTELAEIVTALT
jgi:uncharacterized protein